MDNVNFVSCCKEFGGFLVELPIDQDTEPGYRNIRLEVISPGGALRCSQRVRFCPWCGTEFKTECPPGTCGPDKDKPNWSELPLDEEFLRIVLLESRTMGKDITVEPYKSYNEELAWRRTEKYSLFIDKKPWNVGQVYEQKHSVIRMNQAFLNHRERLAALVRDRLCSHKTVEGCECAIGTGYGTKVCPACGAPRS